MSDILYKEISFTIVGARFAVDNELGRGFLKAVCHECLRVEFLRRGIPFRPNFICYDANFLEIKAVSELANENRAKLHNDMKVAKLR